MAKPTYEELMKERNELREQVETLHSNEKELDEARVELASMKAQLTKERDEAQILRAEIISKEKAEVLFEEENQKVKQYLLAKAASPPGGLHLQDFRGTKTPAYQEWLAAQDTQNTQPAE